MKPMPCICAQHNHVTNSGIAVRPLDTLTFSLATNAKKPFYNPMGLL